MKKTILSIALASILGLSLTGCGGGATKSNQEIIDDALNNTKQDASVSTSVLNKLSKNYNDKYLPLYDAQNDNMQAIRLYDNMTKVDLYDALSGAKLSSDTSVSISADGKTLTLKNLYGQNQDLVLDIIKKDGGEFLTKGNTTWDTGITCDSVDEVKEKLDVIVDDIVNDYIIDNGDFVHQIPIKGMSYDVSLNEFSLPINKVVFTKQDSVTFYNDSTIVFSGLYTTYIMAKAGKSWDEKSKQYRDYSSQFIDIFNNSGESLIRISCDMDYDDEIEQYGSNYVREHVSMIIWNISKTSMDNFINEIKNIDSEDGINDDVDDALIDKKFKEMKNVDGSDGDILFNAIKADDEEIQVDEELRGLLSAIDFSNKKAN